MRMLPMLLALMALQGCASMSEADKRAWVNGLSGASEYQQQYYRDMGRIYGQPMQPTTYQTNCNPNLTGGMSCMTQGW